MLASLEFPKRLIVIKKLTDKQLKVYRFICRYFIANQGMPTYADIAKEFNMSSANSGAEHVKWIIKKGWLVTRTGKTPAYKLANVKITIEDI